MQTEIKNVQLLMRESTLMKVEELKELMETNNRTQIVAMSIALARDLLKRKKEGGKLLMEYPDHRTVELEILGA